MNTPIFMLKRRARILSREKHLPLHQALDEVARSEGFQAWSHLSASRSPKALAAPASVMDRGELLLIGARPGQGKTLFGLGMAAKAVEAGYHASIFSLEETEQAIRARLERLRHKDAMTSGRLRIDVTDGLDADHIAARLALAAPGDLAVIDYLQILDQNRKSPPLRDQLGRLRALARDRQIRIAFLTQIDRRFELSGKSTPDITDVRRPEAIGEHMFDKACFLHRGKASLVTLRACD